MGGMLGMVSPLPGCMSGHCAIAAGPVDSHPNRTRHSSQYPRRRSRALIWPKLVSTSRWLGRFRR